MPFIELALTTFHVSNDYPKKPFQVLGRCGVGVTCVNAVSDWMLVKTTWEGREYQIRFSRGRIQEQLRLSQEQNLCRGTIVRFKPDPEIFKAHTFDRNFLATRLDQLAVLHPGLTLVLEDERRNPARKSLTSLYHYPKGIVEYLKVISAGAAWLLPEPLVLKDDGPGLKIALGFHFTETGNTSILSFVNSSPTIRDGTHVKGFLNGLAEGLNALPKRNSTLVPSDCHGGLNAVVAVWLTDPRFGGAAKDELINPEVEIGVRDLTLRGFKDWASNFSDQAKWLRESLVEKRQAKDDER